MSRPIILIVDDSPENLMVLGELLHGDYQVRAANSGATALRLAALKPVPDLILLDVLMPDCEGTEVARHLRVIVPDAKIIMLSASSEPEHIREAIIAGADGYLTKSLSAKKLFELLQEAAADQVVITPDVAAQLFK